MTGIIKDRFVSVSGENFLIPVISLRFFMYNSYCKDTGQLMFATNKTCLEESYCNRSVNVALPMHRMARQTNWNEFGKQDNTVQGYTTVAVSVVPVAFDCVDTHYGISENKKEVEILLPETNETHSHEWHGNVPQGKHIMGQTGEILASPVRGVSVSPHHTMMGLNNPVISRKS